MPKVLIFGGTGGIGSATVKLFKAQNYDVVCLGKKDLDLSICSYNSIWHLLEIHDPDIIVYSAGMLKTSIPDEQVDLFSVNFFNAHNVVLYYIRNSSRKPVNITYVGSSSYNKVNSKFVLYAASKAALVSMVKSVCLLLTEVSEPQIYVNLVNPCKTNTKMRKEAVGNESTALLLSPEFVAFEIFKLSTLQFGGEIIDLEI